LRRLITILILFTITTFNVLAQAPTANFNLPTEACLQENIYLENTSINASSFFWDFCTGDFALQPTAEIFTNSSNYNTNNNINIYFEDISDTIRYVFLPSGGAKKVFRFTADDQLNDIYTTEELNLSSISLGRPIDISILKTNTDYLGYLIDFNTNSLIEINFGDNIQNQPISITDLGNFGSLNQPLAVKAFIEGDDIKVLIANYNSTNLTIVTKNNDNTFNHENFNTGTSRGSDIDVLELNNKKYAVMTFPNSGRVKVYGFDANINASPNLLIDYNNTNMPSPNNAKWLFEGGEPKILIQSNNANVGLMKLTSDITSVYEFINYGNFGLPNNSVRGLSISQNDKSEWHALIPSLSNNINKINFINPCEVKPGISILENPSVTYLNSGNHNITLTAIDGSNSNSATKELTVTNNLAPSGKINIDSVFCISKSINFSFTTTDNISTYNWDFGDGSTSTDISPSYQYASDGEYIITLEVESAVGCSNIFYDTLSIFPEPQPEFSTVETEYCTFESILFNNDTPFDFGENVAWSWDFNGEGSSTEKNPEFSFETEGTKTVTLEANVLGCIKTYDLNLNIIDGPQPNFIYDKNCLNEVINFNNISTGSNITGYQWDFGDGNSSTLENPQHTYSNSGSFAVNLVVTNTNGCENSITKFIQVFEQVIDSIKKTEAIENLPFSLGIDWLDSFDSTQSINYQWEIEGNFQTTDTATYTLPAGTYTIDLQITNANNCIFTASQLIEVLTSEEPTLDFILPMEVCQDEQFQIDNASANSESYRWDFCTGNFEETPVGGDFLDDSPFSSTNNVKIYHDDSAIFAFVPSRGTSNIYRASIGENLELIDQFEPLIGAGTNISGPIDFDIVKIDNNYFGYAIDFDNRRIYKLDFNNSLSNQPTFEDLGQFEFMNGAYGIAAIKDNDFTKLIISNFSNNNLGLVSIDSENNISIETINLGNRSRGVDLYKRNGNFYGAVAIENASIVRILDFGDSVNSSIVNSYDISIVDLPNPNHIKLFEEGGDFQALVYANNSNFANLNFGNSLSEDPFVNFYGNLEVLNTNVRGFDIFQNNQSNWKALFIETNGDLKQVSFDKECGLSNTPLSTVDNPLISYSQPGTYPITLTAYHPNGNSASLTKEITVTLDVAPEINTLIANSERCIGSTINFEANSPDVISNWLWTFGNGDSANIQNPSYIFDTPGTYEVVVEGESINGCTNKRIETIEIYEPPTVTFSRSSQGALCSLKPIQFTNTSSLPTEASFVWDFGDGNVSTEENPEHFYTEAGTYEVALVIEMAGCTSSLSQSVEVNPGPNVNFAEASNCFGQVIEFNNISSGEFITGYSWNFGDGSSSTQQNPVHSYDTPGIKTVELTAFTTNGCDYTITEEIEVFPLADVNFTVDPACEGTEVQFNEDISLNNANVADYLWDFGVTGISSDISNLANPLYAYEEAGTYEVRLQVTTEDGCTTFETKTITVSESPEPSISFAPSCLGEEFVFSGNDNDNIENHFWSLKTMEGDELTTSTSPFLSYTFSESGNYIVSYRQETEQLCSQTVEEEITILAPPTAAFTTQNQCVGSPIQLTNNSALNGNQVSSYKWFLNDELFSTEENPTLTTEDAGSVEIRLEVETATACMVSISQTINIANSPNPNFILSSPIVAVPYDLNLSTSLNSGESAKWYINDELISESSNLVQSIDSVGLYFVSLEISNEQGCTETMNKQLSARKPELNIALNNIQAVEGNGFTEFILTLSNKGSLVPDYYNLSLNFDEYSVTERLETEILPEKLKNERLSVQLSSDQLRGIDRICIEAIAVKGAFEESNITDNRSCINITSDFKVLPVYPNPSRKNITIPIILPQSGMVEFLVEQSDGKTAQQFNQSLEAGYNEIVLSKADLKEGIYFIRIRYNQKEDVRKIVFY